MSSYFKNEINYSLGDEDSSLEYEILESHSKLIIGIAGSGARVLPLLAKMPEKMICVDLSPMQLFLTQLRIAAVKQMDYDEFLGFLGYPKYCVSPELRKKLFMRLVLPEDVKRCLLDFMNINNWMPIIYTGKFEKTLIKFSKIFKYIMGDKITDIFRFDNIHDQKNYYFSKISTSKRFKLLLALLGNSALLNYLLYKGEFPKKNLSISYFQLYYEIFRSLFTKFLARDSFFLQLIILGKIAYMEGNPLEAQHGIFTAIKKNIADISIDFIQGDIFNAICDCHEKVGFVSLSDVPSFLSSDSDSSFLQKIKHNIKANGKIVFRGHSRIVNPDISGFDDITERFRQSMVLEKTQLWQSRVLMKNNDQ